MIKTVARILWRTVRVIVWAWVSFAATTSYIADAWIPPASFDMTIVPDTPEGWFNPIYPVHRLPERWQIGKHTYTTRDLMGRSI